MCSQQRVCCLKIQLIKLALCEVEEVKFVCASNSGLSEEANAGCGLSRNILKYHAILGAILFPAEWWDFKLCWGWESH